MRKIAMLVANDTFPEDDSIPPLRFTQNDASALKEVLDNPETCGFETKIYLNETSQKVLANLEQISGVLEQDDTLLFYYAGHGRLRRDGQLCLASKDTTMANLGARSIRARDVLNYLQESNARRRVLILDCCYSGHIGQVYKGGNTNSALAEPADAYGTYILTTSTGDPTRRRARERWSRRFHQGLDRLPARGRQGEHYYQWLVRICIQAPQGLSKPNPSQMGATGGGSVVGNREL